MQVIGEANFLQKIKGYEKDSVSPAVIAKIKKYVTMPDFTYEEVRRRLPHDLTKEGLVAAFLSACLPTQVL